MVPAILASSMAFIDSTALNVVLPSLQKSLNASGTDLFWLLNAYLLMLASLILIGGALGDQLGRKKVFMVGIFVFICGSAACGLAPTVTLLIIFRVIQGIGGALMIPGSLSLISSSINDKDRGKAIGIWSAATTFVTMGGPILGGALGDAGLWRFIFFINIPIGIAALLVLWIYVDEIKGEDDELKIDFPGAITIALGLALITFGFLRIPALGFNNGEVYFSLSAGLLLFVAFIIIQSKSKHPMMPLHLFGNLTFSGANLLTLFLYAGLGAGMLFMSLNLVQVQGYSQKQSGLTFLPFTVMMVTIVPISGFLADKYGPKPLLIAGPAVTGAGLLVLSFIRQTAGPSAYFTTFFPGIALFGLGMSLTVAPLTTAVMGAVSNQFAGTASGINNAISRIANVFAYAIFGALAVLFFSTSLSQQLNNLPVNTSQRNEIMTQAVNLGNAKPPANIADAHKSLVEQFYHESFIAAYSIILKLSAGLAFLAALMPVIFIHNQAVKKKAPEAETAK